MEFKSHSSFESPAPGWCYLIGAGPGDPELLTLRGQSILQKADVIVYDYLCHPSLLRWAKPSAELIFAGKLSGNATLKQEETNQLLIQKAKAGFSVARLKGGDPYIFGRGGEEALELVKAGIPFEVVPGVSSMSSVPAYAGIPITHRDYCSAFLVATGHIDPNKGEALLDYVQIANFQGTRLLLMGMSKLPEITTRLMEAGAAKETPAAIVQWGTLGRQKVVYGVLSTIAQQAEIKKLTAPAIIILGDVVQLHEKLNWFEKKPLFGKKILVTRAQMQIGKFSQSLRHLGADVLELPLIKITPLPHSSALTKAIETCSSYQWLIFTSLNGIKVFFESFKALSQDIRKLATIKIAVVGKESANFLKKHYHLQADIIAPEATSESLAATLVALPLKEKNILLIQGNLAKQELYQKLIQIGAYVERIEAYLTETESKDLFQARSRLEIEGVDWVIFTSASTVVAWHQLDLKLPTSWQAVSLGPMTSEKLNQLGYKNILQSETPSLESLISLLLKNSRS